jgi:hypothetical protein
VNRSLPPVAAAAATVEAAPLEATREGVPGSGTGAAGAAPREAAEAGLAEGGSEAGQCRNWLSGFGSGLVGGRGIRPLTLPLLAGRLRNHRRGRGGLAEVAVDQCEGHPGVRSGRAVDGSPGGEGRQGLLEAGSFLAGQQVAGRDNHAVCTGAEPPLDKLVEGGGGGNGYDSDSVFEHRGEPAHFVDAPLHVLNQTFLPKIRHGAVQHNASRREGKIAQNVAKIVSNFIERPPLHSYDGGTSFHPLLWRGGTKFNLTFFDSGYEIFLFENQDFGSALI